MVCIWVIVRFISARTNDNSHYVQRTLRVRSGEAIASPISVLAAALVCVTELRVIKDTIDASLHVSILHPCQRVHSVNSYTNSTVWRVR
jgi:hypothetical protein